MECHVECRGLQAGQSWELFSQISGFREYNNLTIDNPTVLFHEIQHLWCLWAPLSQYLMWPGDQSIPGLGGRGFVVVLSSLSYLCVVFSDTAILPSLLPFFLFSTQSQANTMDTASPDSFLISSQRNVCYYSSLLELPPLILKTGWLSIRNVLFIL